MFQRASEASAIFGKLGATIWMGADQNGHLHFVTSFADWGAWAKFAAAAEASKEVAAFNAKLGADPSATNVNTLFLDQPLLAKVTPVTVVYHWEIDTGKTGAFVALAQEAAGIQAKLGASPGINVDDVGDVWYETAFDSWAAWAAFEAAAAKSKEWSDFLARANKDPIAHLTRVIRIQQFNPPK